jgi:hypothetical protein
MCQQYVHCAATVGYKGLQYVQLLMTLRVWNMCSFCWLHGSAICAATVGSLGLQYVQLLLAPWVCNMCSFCWLYSGSAICAATVYCWLYGSAICVASVGMYGSAICAVILDLWVCKYAASVDSMGLQYMFSTSPYYAETYINNTE